VCLCISDKLVTRSFSAQGPHHGTCHSVSVGWLFIVSLHTVNSVSSRRADVISKSPAASQFTSPLSTIIASPSPDKQLTDSDDIDTAAVQVAAITHSLTHSVMTREAGDTGGF